MNGAARVLAVTAGRAPPTHATWVCLPNASPSCRIPWRSRSSSRRRSGSAFATRLGVEGPVVAYLGKLTPRKRVDLLVRAFAVLRAPNGTLVVAGNDMGGGDAARARPCVSWAWKSAYDFHRPARRPRRGSSCWRAPTSSSIRPSTKSSASSRSRRFWPVRPSSWPMTRVAGKSIAVTGGGLVVQGDADAHSIGDRSHPRGARTLAGGRRGSRQTGEGSLRAGRRLRAARSRCTETVVARDDRRQLRRSGTQWRRPSGRDACLDCCAGRRPSDGDHRRGGRQPGRLGGAAAIAGGALPADRRGRPGSRRGGRRQCRREMSPRIRSSARSIRTSCSNSGWMVALVACAR